MARMVIDGAFNDRKYGEAPVKIAWILKEALDYGQKCQTYLLKDALEKKRLGNTWETMAYAAHAVINGWETGEFETWEEVPSVAGRVGEILYSVALVNVNKKLNDAQNGYSCNHEICREYNDNAALIESQIKGFSPDIIVFGYPEELKCIVRDIFKRMTGEDYDIDEQFGTFAVTIRQNRLFIWAYHPGFYRSEEEGEFSKYKYFESFVKSVKFFKQKCNELKK